MNAGDVSGGHTSSRESWLSARLGDPNAALWASITPPANPNIATIVRRRAAAFSLDLMAQHLYLAFPTFFGSRATARTSILAAAVAFGAALGTLGYLALGPRSPGAETPMAASEAREAHATPAAPSATLRQGETEIAAAAPSATLATTAPSHPSEQLVQPLMASADAADPSATSAKAKRSVTKKRSKSATRRASKRRARALVE